MAGVTSLVHDALNSYHRLNPVIRGSLSPLVILLEYLPPIFIRSGYRAERQRSTGLRDFVRTYSTGSGIPAVCIAPWFTASLLGALTPYLRLFDLKLLLPLHYILRGIVFYLIAEFIAYWYHRWQHSNRLLWAFHTTHHTQRHLSFATLNRFHPIDEFLMDIIPYVPLLMLGATVKDWAPLFWMHRFLVYLQHSEVQCRFGPLGKIFVSPHFHAFHHSTDPAHYNHNFGATLSVRGLIALELPSRSRSWPSCYGLPDVEMTTIASTFLVPFRLVYETYFKKTSSRRTGGSRLRRSLSMPAAFLDRAGQSYRPACRMVVALYCPQCMARTAPGSASIPDYLFHRAALQGADITVQEPQLPPRHLLLVL